MRCATLACLSILLLAPLVVGPGVAYGTTVAMGPFSGAPADVARHAAEWSLGAPLPAASTLDVPELTEAARRLMERHGGSSPGVLVQLAAVPAVARGDLATVMTRFMAFEDAALAHLADGQTARLFAERQALFEATLALQARLAYLPAAPVVVDASPAFTLDLQGVDSSYPKDVALQVDAGGADTYANRAGGGVGDTGQLGLCDPAAGSVVLLPAGYVADFGGDDAYASGRRCGVNGGGMAGAGFLYDAAGNDRYESGQGGVNGGGYLAGVGFLYDAAGRDVYDAQVSHDAYAYGANGSGATAVGGVPAYGTLIDVKGDDVYVAGQEGANGGGYATAVGILLDGAGNDRYSATMLGVNGAGWIGRGMLWDGAGDDHYAALGCCGGHEPTDNGGGSAGSGCLYDGDGHDGYEQMGAVVFDATVSPKGVQGAQIDDVGRAQETC